MGGEPLTVCHTRPPTPSHNQTPPAACPTCSNAGPTAPQTPTDWLLASLVVPHLPCGHLPPFTGLLRLRDDSAHPALKHGRGVPAAAAASSSSGKSIMDRVEGGNWHTYTHPVPPANNDNDAPSIHPHRHRRRHRRRAVVGAQQRWLFRPPAPARLRVRRAPPPLPAPATGCLRRGHSGNLEQMDSDVSRVTHYLLPPCRHHRRRVYIHIFTCPCPCTDVQGWRRRSHPRVAVRIREQRWRRWRWG